MTGNEFLATAVIVFVLLVVGLLLGFARRAWPVWETRILTQISQAQWETLRSVARTAILAAEQIANQMGLDTGEKKKAFVVSKILEQATAMGLLVTREQVELLVEGVLKEIKRETTGMVIQELKEVYDNTYG